MHDDSTQTMTLYWLSSVVPHRWKILDFSWPAISQEFSFLWGYSRQQPLWTTAMHVYHQKTRAPCHVWIVTYDHKTLHDWKISTNFFRNIEKKFQIFLVQVFFQQNKMQIFRLQNNFGQGGVNSHFFFCSFSSEERVSAWWESCYKFEWRQNCQILSRNLKRICSDPDSNSHHWGCRPYTLPQSYSA